VQAGEVKGHPAVLGGHVADQPRHVGRVDHRQRDPVGSRHVAAGVFEVAIGLGLGRYRHIDAAVAGVPVAGEHHHAEHVAGTFEGHLDGLLGDPGHLHLQRQGHQQAPQHHGQQPPATILDQPGDLAGGGAGRQSIGHGSTK
jgi:hypothetical protein